MNFFGFWILGDIVLKLCFFLIKLVVNRIGLYFCVCCFGYCFRLK